ncbi:MAG: hypothetical protein OXC82_03940 [Rhodobacteraceae bacterium]|nr:hypothetical protein [Paracoccaceae bacterium]
MQDHVFPGKDREHHNRVFDHEWGVFPMTGNIARENDFDKGPIALALSGTLHEAFSERAGFCGNLPQEPFTFVLARWSAHVPDIGTVR